MNRIKSLSTKKVILIVWIIFSILYVLYGEWNRFKTVVIDNSIQRGQASAVLQVIQQAQECKAFQIFAGEQKVQLINVDCLQQSDDASESTESVD